MPIRVAEFNRSPWIGSKAVCTGGTTLYLFRIRSLDPVDLSSNFLASLHCIAYKPTRQFIRLQLPGNGSRIHCRCTTQAGWDVFWKGRGNLEGPRYSCLGISPFLFEDYTEIASDLLLGKGRISCLDWQVHPFIVGTTKDSFVVVA